LIFEIDLSTKTIPPPPPVFAMSAIASIGQPEDVAAARRRFKSFFTGQQKIKAIRTKRCLLRQIAPC